MKFLKVEKYTPISEKYKEYLKELAEYCKNTPRHPKFHIHPPCGLLNDPNGLAYFGDKYHVFYQWFPFGPEHGMKHWAHVTSTDLVNWEWSNEILIPNNEYEKNGCYSGNATMANDKLYLYYTANYKKGDTKIPKQAMAIMNVDGTVEKFKNNPIIDEQPEGLTGEIRDPFVFRKNEKYWMLLGGGSLDGKGQLLLYSSDDLYDWNYEGTIKISGIDLECGYMFECPGYIVVDGKDVLTISLMGVEPEGDRYHNEFSSLYFIGKLDLENREFIVDSYDEIDKGFDFYAPQAFYGKNNEPLMFAWIGCGVQNLPYAKEDMWIHSLTMPRVLSIRNGKLCQNVVEQIKDSYDILEVKSIITPPNNTWYMKLEDKNVSQIRIGDNEDYLLIDLIWDNGTVTVDRSNLEKTISEQYGNKRRLCMNEEITSVEIYYDNTFIEIYFNNGLHTITLRAFPKTMEIKLL